MGHMLMAFWFKNMWNSNIYIKVELKSLKMYMFILLCWAYTWECEAQRAEMICLDHLADSWGSRLYFTCLYSPSQELQTSTVGSGQIVEFEALLYQLCVRRLLWLHKHSFHFELHGPLFSPKNTLHWEVISLVYTLTLRSNPYPGK